MKNGIRRHYMTLCIYDDTEVTVQTQNDVLMVTFEQAVSSGFRTVIFDIKGNMISNKGFNTAEIANFKRFLLLNAAEMIKLDRGDYDA